MKFLQHFGYSDACVLFSEQRAKTVYGIQGRAFNLSGIQEHKKNDRFFMGPAYINKQDRQCTCIVILGCILITTVALEKQ
jgi:hypothetical protein